MSSRSEDPPGAHPIPDALEPAVIDWYRGRFHDVSALRPDDPALPEIENDLERSLAAGRRPPEHVRRGLQDLWCEAARTEVQGSRAGRPRRFGPTKPQPTADRAKAVPAHGPDDETTGTGPSAIADLQIGGAQQLVIDLARSAPPDPCRVMAGAFNANSARASRPKRFGTRGRESTLRSIPAGVLHLCTTTPPPAAAWYEMTCDAAFERNSDRPVTA